MLLCCFVQTSFCLGTYTIGIKLSIFIQQVLQVQIQEITPAYIDKIYFLWYAHFSLLIYQLNPAKSNEIIPSLKVNSKYNQRDRKKDIKQS